MEVIQLEKEAGVALVTINRPNALNALNNQVFDELAACLDQLAGDDSVGVVIVTGSGEKSFAAGADIKELSALDAFQAKQQSRKGQLVFNRIENLGKPVIAAVNGFALGGGCELAMACTMRFASDNAIFGLPEVSLGLIPGYAGTQRLPRLVGKGRAMELVLTGGKINAERAEAIGLVNQVTSQEELLPHCRKVAGKINAMGPVAVRQAMEAVNYGLETTQDQGEVFEANLFGLVAATEDAKEGLTAFIEKRKPEFKGR